MRAHHNIPWRIKMSCTFWKSFSEGKQLIAAKGKKENGQFPPKRTIRSCIKFPGDGTRFKRFIKAATWIQRYTDTMAQSRTSTHVKEEAHVSCFYRKNPRLDFLPDFHRLDCQMKMEHKNSPCPEERKIKGFDSRLPSSNLTFMKCLFDLAGSTSPTSVL